MSASAEFDKAWVIESCNKWLDAHDAWRNRWRENHIAQAQKRWLPWLKPHSREKAISILENSSLWGYYQIKMNLSGLRMRCDLEAIKLMCDGAIGSTVRLSADDAYQINYALKNIWN